MVRRSSHASDAEAITHIEEIIIERRRLLDEHDSPDPDALNATDVFHPPMPPVLLLIHPPAAGQQTRLRTAMQLGHPLLTHAVLLGTWPAGSTITVAPDGHLTTTDGHQHRLAVLNLTTARELLPVILETHNPTTHVEVPRRPAEPANDTASNDPGHHEPDHDEPDHDEPAISAPTDAAPADLTPADATPASAHPVRARADTASAEAAADAVTDSSTDAAVDAVETADPLPGAAGSAEHAVEQSAAGGNTTTPRPTGHSGMPGPDGTRSGTASASDRAAESDHGAVNGSSPPRRPRRAGRVQVRVFGAPTVVSADGVAASGIRRYARELLVHLALHPDGVDLPTIMEAFWPDATVRRASERLSTEAANLRRHIRIAAGDPTVQPVLNSGGRYRLNPDVVTVDLWEFNTAVQTAQAPTQAAHNGPGAAPAGRVAALDRAVAVVRGLLGDGVDSQWLHPHREHYRHAAVAAHLDLARELAASHPDRVLTLATAAVEFDPCTDHTTQQAMRTVAATADHTGTTAVTNAVDALLHLLRDALHDIGEQPSPDTIALAATLRQPPGPTDTGTAGQTP